jgi:hypothetical protein
MPGRHFRVVLRVVWWRPVPSVKGFSATVWPAPLLGRAHAHHHHHLEAKMSPVTSRLAACTTAGALAVGLGAVTTAPPAKAWADKAARGANAGAPPIRGGGFDSRVVSPGRGMSLHYSAPAGDYVLVGWWPDAEMGGMPHALMGMYRGITLR